jgi:hypothetical protein
MNTLFTHIDDIEGKVGIGKLPNELHSILDDISKEYYDIIPDKNVSTHHIWCDNMPTSIKSKVEQIQKNRFWNKLCNESKKCIKININEMDELYYSNFKKTANNTLSQNLYGSSGNIVIHKDCHHICSFKKIVLYRIIIGLSDSNDNIITKFTELDIEKKINKNDYVLFDFSRTTHQVIKENETIQTPRILLKLHFIVCEDNCKYSKTYINFLKNYFITYDTITRYLLKNGTDPETFYQFFIGLCCQYFYTPFIQYIILFITITIIIILNIVFKIKLIYKNYQKIIKYVLFSLIFIYLMIVTFYWLRYKLFGIK